jgi:hypothetical protein
MLLQVNNTFRGNGFAELLVDPRFVIGLHLALVADSHYIPSLKKTVMNCGITTAMLRGCNSQRFTRNTEMI